MPRERIGKCHICGRVGPLTFEHIPPRKAFNEKLVIKAKFKELVGIGPNEPIRGTKQQKGMGEYTLCPVCNNNTGSWYAKDFVDWCYQGYDILFRSKGNPSLIYLNNLYPLRILKQIITMFFSINSPKFCDAHPELVKFVLNRDKKYLSQQYGFFVYYSISSRLKYSGVSASINTKNICVFSEMNYFPLGYVTTFDSPPPDSRLVDITHFSTYSYNEFKIMEIKLPVLPTNSKFPGDYRTKEQIIKDREKSENKK